MTLLFEINDENMAREARLRYSMPISVPVMQLAIVPAGGDIGDATNMR